jgi:GAF domain-containing protein
MFVPIRNGSVISGVLSIQSYMPYSYTAEDLDTLQVLADHAGGALDRIRAQTERDQLAHLLQRQNKHLSLLYNIALDLLNRHRLDELLQTITEHAADLLDAPHGELALLEGDELVTQATTANQLLLLGSRAPRGEGLLSWQAVDTGQPATLEDYSAWRSRRSLYETVGLRAVASFPIMIGRRCLGVLDLGRYQPDYPFDAEQTQAGMLLAQLAALALDNARLYAEGEKQLADLSLLLEGSVSLSGSLQLDQVLQQAAGRLARATQADACAISGYYPMAEAVVTLAQHNVTDEWIGDEVGKVFRLADYPATRTVLENHTCLVIRADDTAADPAETALLREWGVQSLLMLPLAVSGRPIGLVEIYRVRPPADFAPADIALCEVLAQQAAVAIENARLYEQSQQELARRQRVENEVRSQKELLQSLVMVARAATEYPNLEATLQNVLAVARQLTAAEGGTIFLLDEERIISRSIAIRDRATTRKGGPFASGAKITGLAGWVVDRQQPALVADTLTDPRWLKLPGDNTRSALAVPITSGSWVGGAISLTHVSPGHFSHDHLFLMESAANQIALALRNVQIIESQHRTVERQTMLYEVLQAAGGQLNVEALVQAAMKTIARYTGWARIGIALPSEDQRRLMIYASDNLSQFPRSQYIGQGVAGRAYMSGETQYVPDVAADPDYLPAGQGIGSELTIPLRRGENVLGVLNLESDELDAFGREDCLLAESLADAIALALDNAHLYQDIQKHLVELSALYSVTQMTTQSLVVADVLNQALLSALTSLGFEYGFIALADEFSGKLQLVVSHQLPPTLARYLQARDLDQTLFGYVHNRQQSLILPDVTSKSAPAVRAMAEELAGLGVRGYAGAPLLDYDRSLGVICLFVAQPLANQAVVPTLLAAIGHQIALAVANAQLHQAIAQKHSQLGALIESSRDGILLIGPNRRILVVNAMTLELLRIPGQPQEWTNRPLNDALALLRTYAPDVVRATIAEMRRVQQGNEATGEGEYEVMSRVIHWVNLPVLADDHSLGRLIILHDVSTERALEQMREDLVRDLRNPLTSISGSLALLAEDLGPGTAPSSRQMLDIAQHGVQQLLRLSNTILDMNRLESGRMSLNCQAAGLIDLADEALRLHHSLADERKIILKNEVEPDLPPLWVDVELIRRVLHSLVGNAMRFTLAEGVITIQARLADDLSTLQEMILPADHLLITIQGSRPVISWGERGRFFAAGRQTEQGRGVGLAFCRLVVEAHGGRIWMEGSPGQGTAVQFILPAGKR